MIVFDYLEVRSMGQFVSEIQAYSRYVLAPRVTILYKNDTDQPCTIEIQGSGSRGFEDPAPIDTFDCIANMEDSDYEWFDIFFPFIRLMATFLVAPTDGELSAWIEP